MLIDNLMQLHPLLLPCMLFIYLFIYIFIYLFIYLFHAINCNAKEYIVHYMKGMVIETALLNVT